MSTSASFNVAPFPVVNWIDTPGVALPNETEAIDFTALGEVLAISVSFTGGVVEERAYREGVFVPPYLASTQAGGTFSLKRAGGWPGDLTVHVDTYMTPTELDDPDATDGTVTGPESSTPGNVAVWEDSEGTELTQGPPITSLASTAYVDAAVAAASSGWITSLNLDFSVQPAQTIATGLVTIGGKVWTAVDIATYSNLCAIVAGSGLEWKGNALNAAHYVAVRTFPHLKIKIKDLIPDFHPGTHALRLSAIMTGTGQAQASEIVEAGICNWTHHATDTQTARLVRGFVSAASNRRCDLWRSSLYVNNDDAMTTTSDLIRLTLTDPAELKGSFSFAPSYTWASPVAWPDWKNDEHFKGFDATRIINSSRVTPAGTDLMLTTRPFWKTADDVALIIGLQTGNTLNNTAYKGIIRALKLEYKYR